MLACGSLPAPCLRWCKISGNVSDRALKWMLSGGCFGCEERCSREYSFWIFFHPGVHSHQWGLWAILESLDKYSNKCSYLYMLANFYRLFINSLLPHSDQNFWFADGDNIRISGLGCWWWKCATVSEGFPLIDIWPQHLWTVLRTRRIHGPFALICTGTHWFGTMMTTVLLLIVSC